MPIISNYSKEIATIEQMFQTDFDKPSCVLVRFGLGHRREYKAYTISVANRELTYEDTSSIIDTIFCNLERRAKPFTEIQRYPHHPAYPGVICSVAIMQSEIEAHMNAFPRSEQSSVETLLSYMDDATKQFKQASTEKAKQLATPPKDHQEEGLALLREAFRSELCCIGEEYGRESYKSQRAETMLSEGEGVGASDAMRRARRQALVHSRGEDLHTLNSAMSRAAFTGQVSDVKESTERKSFKSQGAEKKLSGGEGVGPSEHSLLSLAIMRQKRIAAITSNSSGNRNAASGQSTGACGTSVSESSSSHKKTPLQMAREDAKRKYESAKKREEVENRRGISRELSEAGNDAILQSLSMTSGIISRSTDKRS